MSYQINDRHSLVNSPYKISTLVVISDINTKVDLGLVYKYLPHYPCGALPSEWCPTCYRPPIGEKCISSEFKGTIHPIQSINYKPKSCEEYHKGKPLQKKAKRKNSKQKKTFFNQITLDIIPFPGRKISSKLYINGKVQMAGCQNEEEANKTIEILIKYLKNIGNIKEPGEMEIKMTNNEKDELMEKKKSLNEDEWRKLLFEVCRESKKTKKTGNKKGRKKKGTVVEEIKEENIQHIHKFLYIRKLIEDIDDMKLTSLTINLINSDFKFQLKDNKTDIIDDIIIDREKLIEILKTKYGIKVMSFDPSIYPGINAKYYSSIDCNNDCKNNTEESIKCATNHQKNKNNKVDEDDEIIYNKHCVKISILCFQQARVILTGARSLNQLNDTYNFFVDVMRNNIKDICDDTSSPKKSKKNKKDKKDKNIDDISDYDNGNESDSNSSIMSDDSCIC